MQLLPDGKEARERACQIYHLIFVIALTGDD
jgi:hypothetical protein